MDANGICQDNGWVVPYNPVHFAHFDAHINVEVCASMQLVKYIHKYVYKSRDQA